VDDVQDHAQGVIAGAGIGGIEHQIAAGGADEFGMGAGDMSGGPGGFKGGEAGTEGIDPGVELEAAFVGFGDGKSQGIIIGRGRDTHGAGEILGPRLDPGIVEGVAAGTDLQQDGVEMQLSDAVEDGEEFLFLLSAAEAGTGGPVLVVYGGHPDAAKFPRGGRRGLGQSGQSRTRPLRQRSDKG